MYKGQIQPDGYLPVERLICDQQDNASDCGVFAIAFAFELADGRSLNGVTFTRRRMREHLATAFESKKLLHFPVSRHKKQKLQIDNEVLKL